MSIIDRTAKFLTGKTEPTAAAIGDEKAAVTARLAEIERRLNVITKRDLVTARESGDQKTVDAIASEHASLRDEEKTLLARRSRLHKDLKAAQGREAVKNATHTKARLASMVGDIETMKAQLADAQHSLMRATSQLVEARSWADKPEALMLDRSLAERIARIQHGNSNLRAAAGDRLATINRLSPSTPKRMAPQHPVEAKGALVPEGA